MLKKLLFILPFISFITGYMVIQWLFTTKEIYVPALVGKNLSQACELLAAQNLNIRILAHKEDSDLAPDTILSQTPQANEKVKPHQSIYVVLSTHGALNHASNLIHKSLNTINPELEKQGIKATVHHVPSSYPKGTCIAQLPRPGEIIEKNNITLYCAAESKKPVLWPDFRGKQLGTVKELLETIHSMPQIIAAPHHHVTDSSVVLDQRPKAGTLLILDESKPINVQLSVD